MLLSWELIISATLWLINVPERWASIFWALNRVASLATLEDESRCKNRWKGNRTASWIPKHTEYLSIGLNYFDLDELSTDAIHNIGHFRCTLIPQMMNVLYNTRLLKADSTNNMHTGFMEWHWQQLSNAGLCALIETCSTLTNAPTIYQ